MGPTFWQWWILAGLCLMIEALAPGFVFLWLGISAGITGLLTLIVPGLGWQWQTVAFAVLSLASVAGWLTWRGRHPAPGEASLNRRAEACVGRIAVLETPLRAGAHARVRLGDTTWAASGPDLPVGARVRIVGALDTVLLVEPAKEGGTAPL